jgi:DNA modification methylase
MSRTGSFPLHVALELLEANAHKNATILDPFCGKGTSLLAARLLGHKAYGIDVAPEAIVCSSAKLADVTLTSICSYISNLKVPHGKSIDPPANVRVFFHRATLTQILAFRAALQRDLRNEQATTRDHAIFAMALLLGILHGHASYSLSVPSAHAFSMSPGYVKKYCEDNNLLAPKRDVRECLLRKAMKCLAKPLPAKVESMVHMGSAVSVSAAFRNLVGKVDIILTSPPYLNAQTYSKDNWLRLWLLGYDHKVLRHSYLETGSISRFGQVMSEVFNEFSIMLRPGGLLICIAGDVSLGKRNGRTKWFKTGEFLAEKCTSDSYGFQILKREEHIVASTNRYLHMIVNSNGHSKRTLKERIFIARKGLARNR